MDESFCCRSSIILASLHSVSENFTQVVLGNSSLMSLYICSLSTRSHCFAVTNYVLLYWKRKLLSVRGNLVVGDVGVSVDLWSQVQQLQWRCDGYCQHNACTQRYACTQLRFVRWWKNCRHVLPVFQLSHKTTPHRLSLLLSLTMYRTRPLNSFEFLSRTTLQHLPRYSL